MELNIKKSFWFNFTCAKLFGFYGDTTFSKRKLRDFIFLSIVVFPCVASLMTFLTHRNLQTFNDVSTIFVTFSCFGFSLIILMLKKKKFEKCLKTFHDLDALDEDEILKQNDNRIYILMFFNVSCYIFTSVLYVIVTSIWRDEGSLIMPFPIDIKNDYLNIFMISFQAYIAVLAATINSAVTTIIITFLAVYAANIDCLRIRIEKLSNEDIKQDLQICVEYHVKLMELFETIRNIFKESIFYQSNVTVIILCTLTYQLTEISALENLAESIKIIFVASMMIFQIYLPHLFGSIIAEKSLKVREAAYFSKWYDMNIEARRSLSIIMTQKEMKMDIMGFNIMNLEYFMTICNRTYSLYCLLKQFQ